MDCRSCWIAIRLPLNRSGERLLWRARQAWREAGDRVWRLPGVLVAREGRTWLMYGARMSLERRGDKHIAVCGALCGVHAPDARESRVKFERLAEQEGFEPSIRENRIPDFESGAFDHSATAPEFGSRGAKPAILTQAQGARRSMPPR
jgi:hypothetical protein